MKIPEIAEVNILTAVIHHREKYTFVRMKGGDEFQEEEMIEVVFKLEDAFLEKSLLEKQFEELRGKLEILPVTGGVAFTDTVARLSPVLRDRMTRPFTG